MGSNRLLYRATLSRVSLLGFDCGLGGSKIILIISDLQSEYKVLASLFRLILPILLVLSVILQQNYLVLCHLHVFR